MNFIEGHILPTVRIQKIELENFKCVSHGEVVFNCCRRFVPQDTESDILGIYGQNGSGKTSVIEAIAILEKVMSGPFRLVTLNVLLQGLTAQPYHLHLIFNTQLKKASQEQSLTLSR